MTRGKTLLVIGAGTAGTMIVNKVISRLPDGWRVQVVEPSARHVYQPGQLFIPFGKADPSKLVRETDRLLPEGAELTVGEVHRVIPDESQVELADGSTVSYDQLVITTGTSPRPDQTPGMLGPPWRDTIHEFYTLEGAVALREKLAGWSGGRLVIHVTELPIKCPVAPLEFAFLADDFFKGKGMRHDVEISYVTPLSGAFTKPIAASRLGDMLDARHISLEPDFYVERIEDGALVSYDERVVPFDLLVTVPLNMGAPFVGRSGLGDDLDHVRVDPHTFLATGHDNIFAVGDAAALPTSKAGSSAHFSGEVFVENLIDHIAGRPMARFYDGHVNCFVESGGGKALLIDFNYETEPLPGSYPWSGVGPMRLLKETRINHWGKLAFEHVYWHMLLPGRRLPVPTEMSMAGKTRPQSKELMTS